MTLAPTKHGSHVEGHGKLGTCQIKAGDDNAVAAGLALREPGIEKRESERDAKEMERAQCVSLAEAAAAVKQRVHAFMQYRRSLQPRMGKASGAGELALMTKLLGRPRATPAATEFCNQVLMRCISLPVCYS